MSTRKVSGGKGSPGMAGGTYTRPAKKDVNAALKTAKKAKPLAEPKSAVKVKNPAKTKPAPSNSKKMNQKTYNSTIERYERKHFSEPPYNDMGPELTIAKRNMRIINSKNKTAPGKASRPAVSPTNPNFRPRVKINSAAKKK